MADTNSELNRILQEFRLDVIDHFDTGTGNLQQTINEAKAAINQLLLKARHSTEAWLPVVGFEGLYEVSSAGQVRSISRGRNTGRLLKQNIRHERGYLCVQLSKDNVRTTHNVHRLVCMTFLPNPENKRTINHKDSDKNNNTVGNLEWATHSENEKHAHVNGKVPWNKGRFGLRANVPKDRIAELDTQIQEGTE